MKKNKIKEMLLNSDEIILGTYIQTASPENAEIASYSGLDYVIIDTEHGYFGIETAVSLFRAVESAGVVPIIRLPDSNYTGILKALDAGAMGIIIPNVESASQAEDIVKFAKYGPSGLRGSCPWTRSTNHGLHLWKNYVNWSDNETLVWLLIEGEKGIENIEEILSVEGIDAIGIGSFDLSVSMGYGGDVNHPDILEKRKKVSKLAKEKKIEITGVTFKQDIKNIKEDVKKSIEQGIRLINIGSDRAILSEEYSKRISAIKELTK